MLHSLWLLLVYTTQMRRKCAGGCIRERADYSGFLSGLSFAAACAFFVHYSFYNRGDDRCDHANACAQKRHKLAYNRCHKIVANIMIIQVGRDIAGANY